MEPQLKIPNLLIVAGEGTKSGKTSSVCRIIELMPWLEITAVKITPHFHETTPGLVLLREFSGCALYEETERESQKDSSRMLKAGAGRVIFAKSWDASIRNAFSAIIELLPPSVPLICESIALASVLEPGVLVITSSDSINKHKDIKHLKALPHVKMKYETLQDLKELPFDFRDSCWVYK